MENKIAILFKKENKTIELDIKQPDLANLVHTIISEHLLVSKNNLEISSNENNFDKEEFLDLLIEVHGEFCDEINKFYKNIQKEICTYYKDEKLSETIINNIKNNDLN